jgi:hypothetical protein
MVYFVNTLPENFVKIMNDHPMGMTLESGFNRELHGVWDMMIETTRF